MRRSLRPFLFAFCLIPLALLAAGCFSATPTQQDVLVNAARSLSGTKSVRLDAAVQVSVTRRHKTERWSADLRGGVSKPTVSLAGSVDAGKKTYPFALRIAAKTLYAQLKGTWYSAPVGKLKRESIAVSGEHRSLLGKLRTLLAAEDIAAHAFRGTVTHGLKVDGSETWQWQGTVDPEGLLAMAAKYGGDRAKLTPAKHEQALSVLEQLAKLCRITVVTGSDGKPRRLEIDIDAGRQQVAELARAAREKRADDLDAVHATLRLDLSHWNEPVAAATPSGAKPLGELLSGIFSG
jgi:hypothetical protein